MAGGMFPTMDDLVEMWRSSGGTPGPESERSKQIRAESKAFRDKRKDPVGSRFAKQLDASLKMADSRVNHKLNEGYRDAGERQRREEDGVQVKMERIKTYYRSEHPEMFEKMDRGEEPDFGF